MKKTYQKIHWNNYPNERMYFADTNNNHFDKTIAESTEKEIGHEQSIRAHSVGELSK